MNLTVALEERWQTLQEGQRDISQWDAHLAGFVAGRRTRRRRGIYLPLRSNVRLPLRLRSCQRDVYLAVGQRDGGQREEQQSSGKATAYFLHGIQAEQRKMCRRCSGGKATAYFHGLLLFGKVKAQRDVETLHRTARPALQLRDIVCA